MQLRNLLTPLAVCSLAILFSTAIIKAKGNPIKPKMRSKLSASSNEFECGVYKGSEKEILWHHHRYQAKMKSLLKTGARLPSRDFVFDDVAVIEDDDSVLRSGVNSFDTDNQTFRFTPNSSNGYDVSNIAFNFDANFGSNLNLGDDTNATVAIPFTFNYYSGSWTDIHVSANGIVSFGADINPSGFFSNTDFLSTLPKIAAYFMDLDPSSSGGVFAKAESNKLTLTWNQVPAFGTTDLNTIQLVLHDDGTFDVTFNGITSLTQMQNSAQIPIVFGIHPGGDPILEIISFSDDIPFTGPAGTGIFEDYINLLNPQVNETALTNRFYQTYPDSFFQIIFFTNFIQTMPGFAYERTIKNDIEGIGDGIRDFSGVYGSNSVLESVCDMNRLAAWPSPNPESRFAQDGSNFLTILGQEAGHRWGAHVNFVDANGDTSNLILGRSNAHWSYYFDSDHSSLEGGNWELSFGNNYATPTRIDFFSEIDEYTIVLEPGSPAS